MAPCFEGRTQIIHASSLLRGRGTGKSRAIMFVRNAANSKDVSLQSLQDMKNLEKLVSKM